MTATIPTPLTNALAGRYDLRSILGTGGMATVYMAFDRKHDRDVAVKVLRPEIASSLGAERFLSEIQTVARLTHPHILPLHDSGEAEGFVYYVSPFIDGGSLRDRLEASGRCPVEQALATAAPIADALSYAHRKGVFHRDIKPENILFSQGHPIVADFGIAKAVSTASGRNLTRTGVALGTPGYMSPEQAAGFHDLDERTDVYSLAVVVYEMIVGEIPGRWPSEDSVRAGRFLEANPAHRARLGAAGGTVEGALVRALAVRPDQRTATPDALMNELRGSAVPKRRYRPDEIDEIMKRAGELELSTPSQTGAMTIGGVEQVAIEAGFDPKLVRSAAASLTPRATGPAPVPIEPPRRNIIVGGPTRIVFERAINGELAEADFPVVVDEVRRVLQNAGQVSQFGRSFSWTASPSSAGRRDLEVAVSVRGGQTRVVVQEGLGNLVGGLFGGLLGGAGGGGMGPLIGITAGALHRPGALAFIIPAWIVTVFASARTLYYYASRRRQRRLEYLIDRLSSTIRELIDEGPKPLR